MSIRQQAQQQGMDPSRDREYPYDRAHEARVLRDAEVFSTYTVEYWESKRDDFDPDVNVRLSVSLEKVAWGDADGAIYTPEYLERRRTG